MNSYNSIITGLNEAIQFEEGNLERTKIDRIEITSIPCLHGVEIRDIRRKQNMTQKPLAAVLGVSNKTIEAWESDRNIPTGPAQRLFELMQKDDQLFEKYAILSRK